VKKKETGACTRWLTKRELEIKKWKGGLRMLGETGITAMGKNVRTKRLTEIRQND